MSKKKTDTSTPVLSYPSPPPVKTKFNKNTRGLSFAQRLESLDMKVAKKASQAAQNAQAVTVMLMNCQDDLHTMQNDLVTMKSGWAIDNIAFDAATLTCSFQLTVSPTAAVGTAFKGAAVRHIVFTIGADSNNNLVISNSLDEIKSTLVSSFQNGTNSYIVAIGDYISSVVEQNLTLV